MDLQHIKQYFCKAKQIVCLKSKQVISIEYLSDVEYNESDNSVTSKGGAVVLWKNNQFAEIVKTKKQPCVECKKNKK